MIFFDAMVARGGRLSGTVGSSLTDRRPKHRAPSQASCGGGERANDADFSINEAW